MIIHHKTAEKVDASPANTSTEAHVSVNIGDIRMRFPFRGTETTRKTLREMHG